MGTTYQVKFPNGSVDSAGKVAAAIETRLSEIDQRMSTYRDDSEISRFNQLRENDWFPVSSETARVVARSLAISEQTDGAFDITVGPLVRLWNFGAETQRVFEPPTPEQIATTKASVGATQLEVRQDPPALRKQLPEIEIDLSAIAKGYGVDQLAELLIDAGVENFLVEVGGEMRLRGRRPDGELWTVGIESPSRGKRELYGLITPGDTAVASSGDYRNFFKYDGTVYSHTIDPQSGKPVEHSLAAATVLAEDCTTADAVATALLVMGPKRAAEWAVEHQVAALLLERDSENQIKEQTVGSFQNLGMKTVSETTLVDNHMNFMSMLLPALLVFGLAIVGMSIGVIVSNRRIKGSCGGLAGITDDKGRTLCDGCTKPSPECSGNPDEAAV